MFKLSKNHGKNLPIAIKDIVLAVTYQCNGCCQFCNIWQSQKTFSCQPKDYKNLPRNLKNIDISGGEPFLRTDLPEIIRTINSQCPKAQIVISTNGFLPSIIKKRMIEIIKFKRDIGVAVSLDGYGKTHEELRGFPGGFSLALETIRFLKELGIRKLKINFTLGNQNINQLKRVYRLSRELDIKLNLAVCHNSAHYFQKKDNKISKIVAIKKEINWLIEEELKQFSLKRWTKAYFAQGLIKFLEKKQRVLPDYSGLTSIFIDPFGNIYPSGVWNLKIGRLKEINNWNEFANRAKEMITFGGGPANWMICTTRQAIKKHKLKIIWWALKRKFLGAESKKRNSILDHSLRTKFFIFGKAEKRC